MLLLVGQVRAQTTEEYDVDYEEETEAPEAPVVKKPNQKPMVRDSSVQGTKSINKFAPMIHSETKSIYQKNGKHLDVDPD